VAFVAISPRLLERLAALADELEHTQGLAGHSQEAHGGYRDTEGPERRST
jgi:hypothetical protein